MLTHGHQPPGDPTQPGGIFSLSDPDRLVAVLESAGFEDVTVETVEAPHRFVDFGDYWQHISETSGPLTVILDTLPSSEVDAVRTTCQEYATHLRSEDGTYNFPGSALVAAARWTHTHRGRGPPTPTPRYSGAAPGQDRRSVSLVSQQAKIHPGARA